MCSFRSYVSLLIFCLDDLSMDDNGTLKSPTIIILLSISPSTPVNICFIYILGASMLGPQIYTNVTYILLLICPRYHYAMTFFVSHYRLFLKSVLFDTSIDTAILFWFSNDIPFFHLKSVHVLRAEMSLF